MEATIKFSESISMHPMTQFNIQKIFNKYTLAAGAQVKVKKGIWNKKWICMLIFNVNGENFTIPIQYDELTKKC